jgi:hypothetical protein
MRPAQRQPSVQGTCVRIRSVEVKLKLSEWLGFRRGGAMCDGRTWLAFQLLFSFRGETARNGHIYRSCFLAPAAGD